VRAVNYLMDGGSHMDTYLNTNLPFPNPDAVQEFNVATDNLSAQYGIGAGGVVNIVTKSGTNNFHGTAYEYYRDDSMNALNYFSQSQDTLKRNQFGGAIGGPILKNKLFFFGSYEGFPLKSASGANTAFVPTAAERNGDFSASGYTVYDPVTLIPYTNNQIPVNLLSQPAQYFLNHIPLPNSPSQGPEAVVYQGPTANTHDDQYLIKLNWNRQNNTVSGSWFWTKYNQPPDMASGKRTILAADGNGNIVTIKNLALNDTYTLSPKVLFNTWFSWNSQTGGSLSGAPFGYPDAGVNIAAPNPPEIELQIPGYFEIGTNHQGTFNRGNYSIQEDVTLERGRHDIHVGGGALHVTNDLVNTYNMSGEFYFSNQSSGSNLSDFILGVPSGFQQGGGEYKNLSGTLWSLYAQDNIRLSPKLKIEAGVRWDPYYPFAEKRNRVVCYVPGASTPSVRFPNAPLGLLYGTDPGCPKGGSENDSANFAPRLGFSYKVNAKTVVRGGAGFYFTPPETHETNGMADTAPFSPLFSYTGFIDFADPYSTIGIPNPFPAQYSTGNPAQNVQFTLPVSISTAIQHNWHMPELATWNLNLERQLGASWVARASYAGNKGTYLAPGTLSDNELNPAVYGPGATEGNTQQRRVNPIFGNVGSFSSSNNSRYSSIRLNLEKRLSHGYSVLANYTHSKMVDDFSPNGVNGQTNPFNRRFDSGTSNDDIPNIVNVSFTAQVPAVTQLRGISAKLVNGWSFNGLVNWKSGYAFSIFSNVDNSYSGVGSDRADYYGGNVMLDTHRPHSELIAEYFNVPAFDLNAVGTFGNSGKNSLRGLPYFDTDLGLLKDFQIKEPYAIQFRAEFFNAFNNVNFELPNNFLQGPTHDSSGNVLYNIGSWSTGQITSANSARQIQLAVKFRF